MVGSLPSPTAVRAIAARQRLGVLFVDSGLPALVATSHRFAVDRQREVITARASSLGAIKLAGIITGGYINATRRSFISNARARVPARFNLGTTL